ncbi:Lar family restriction alleviation protein [Pseudomonas luteola]|uniref:Lar family restriction alleviation protein n=2 Tax=Pseudomonas TaxID=286 RepID=UPI00123A1287|nr:hypothetical protein [Pseudomonas luteola]QEU28891.1 hypothetical protein FOB45_14345 [Pseudomonas luteola]
MIDLRPCPFCGSDAEAGDGFLPLESIVYVWCKNHECLMSNGVDIGFGVDDWNRRAALVVQLPEEQPGYMYYAPDVVDAIEAAGVRVKP